MLSNHRFLRRLLELFTTRNRPDIYSRPPLEGFKAILKAKVKTEGEFVDNFLMDHPRWSKESLPLRSLAVDRQIVRKEEDRELIGELEKIENKEV